MPEPGHAGPPSPAPGEPLRLALLSDTHTQSLTSPQAVPVNGKLIRAVADLRPFKPDLWVCNGDISDHGYVGEHAAFKEIMATVTRPHRLLVATGNHEFYDREASDDEALARFRRAFGQEQPYSSRVFGSVHIVMLGDEQWKTAPRNPDWAWISAGQLRWFDQVLAQHRDKFTAVFLHQPMPDTVLWTGGGASVAQGKELRAILSRNPQVRLWFSGHTHQPVDVPGQAVTREKTTFIALGSTFYLFALSSTPDFAASQSRMLELYPDRAVVRARDHVRQRWLSDHDVIVQRE